MQLLVDISNHLKALCLAKHGVLHVPTSEVDATVWSSPGVKPGLKIGDIDLDDVAADVFGRDDLSDEAVSHLWDTLATKHSHSLKAQAQGSALLRAALPHIRWAKTVALDPKVQWVQALVALSFSGRPLRVRGGEVTLKLSGRSISIDRDGMNYSGARRRRFPSKIVLPVADALRYPVASPLHPGVGVVGLYRFITGEFPELSAALSYACSAAAYAGAEEALLSCFDARLAHHPVEPRKANAWTRALRLIEASPTFPLKALTRELSRHMTSQEVRDTFRVADGAPYRALVKDRHKKIIRALEAESIGTAGNATTDLQSLIQLQDMLR